MIEDKTKHSEKEIFILSYYEDVKHYLYMFGLGDRLEDAVQDTFVEALANIQNIRYEEKTKHWLIKVAKYVGLKYLRREKNAAVSWYDMEEYLKEADKSGEPVSESQLDDLIEKLDRQKLHEYIGRLKEKERKVIVLYYTYGYRLKEIAVMIRESETNTKSLSRRAKQKLKAMIEEGGLDR